MHAGIGGPGEICIHAPEFLSTPKLGRIFHSSPTRLGQPRMHAQIAHGIENIILQKSNRFVIVIRKMKGYVESTNSSGDYAHQG